MKKRRFFVILAMVLTLTFFLASCNFTVDFSGCSRSNSGSPGTQIGGELTPDVDNSITSFSISMIKRDTLYYPTFEGKIRFAYYPEKISVIVDNVEYELNVETVQLANGYYLFGFNQIIDLLSISKGDYTVTAYGYQGSLKTAVAETFTWTVDDDYFAMTFVDIETGDVSWGLDKESNWTPFY